MLTTQTLELACREAKLRRHVGHGDGACEVLFHEQKRAAHARFRDRLGHRRVRLRVAAGTRPVKEQYLARFVSDCPAEMLLDEIGGERRCAGTACAGDPWPIRE